MTPLFAVYLVGVLVVTGTLLVSIYGYAQEFDLDVMDKIAFLTTATVALASLGMLLGVISP